MHAFPSVPFASCPLGGPGDKHETRLPRHSALKVVSHAPATQVLLEQALDALIAGMGNPRQAPAEQSEKSSDNRARHGEHCDEHPRAALSLCRSASSRTPRGRRAAQATQWLHALLAASRPAAHRIGISGRHARRSPRHHTTSIGVPKREGAPSHQAPLRYPARGQHFPKAQGAAAQDGWIVAVVNEHAERHEATT